MIEAEHPALLIVDLQNDFCQGGALPVGDGDQIVPVVNRLAARAAARGLPVYASRDWHPIDSLHFAAHGGPWPTHCVAGTAGARLHQNLALPSGAMIVTKGATREEHGYSAFEDAWRGEVPFSRTCAPVAWITSSCAGSQPTTAFAPAC